MILKLTERRARERGAQFGKLTFRDPEKHYVRLNGWLEACKTIKHELQDKEFRYFSLCGGEPLDVLLLFREGILTPNRKAPNVTICDVELEALTSAAEALTRAKCGPATKFCSSVEDLVLGGGDLHREFEETLPFHAFNLDFTKSLSINNYWLLSRVVL
jgi:hypothetical protein